MKPKQNFNEILSKIQDMREFLKIGDEVIPFLSDLFKFIQDIIPLMSEANASLRYGTNKIPDATDRISNVNQTTEMATNEILDKLDSISEKLTAVSKNLQTDQRNLIDKMQGEITDIIYALQFQDITSQKLEHANKILKTIYEKFAKIIKSSEQVTGNTKVGGSMVQVMKGEFKKEEREKELAEFEEKTKDLVRDTEISQDDIDQLFQ